MRVKFFFLTIILLTGISAFSAEKKYDWFWMFYENGQTHAGDIFTLRPFYLNLKKQNSNTEFHASLMPMLFWRYKNDRSDDTYGLFGLINSVDCIHQGNEKDFDFNLFPFIYYGSSIDSSDSYLILWPLGGSLKGKFAHEKIGAYVFPGVLLFYFFPPSGIFTLTASLYVLCSFIPLYSTFEHKDYKGWSILWPLIKSGSSPSRSDLRIIPFYSSSRKKGWYESSSYLTIINYQKYFFSNDTRHTLFIFPFYGRKWSDSGRISSTAILWPFFSWGYDKVKKDYQYNLPWPLVQIRDSETPMIKKRIFFPFYGYYSYARNETKFITPLYFNLRKTGESFTSDYYTIGLIWWYFKRDYASPVPHYGGSWRYYKLWPLFSYEYNDIGDLSFNLLSLLPFRDEGGYEPLYEPLWTLFEYKSYASGERRLGFLMRTYYQRSAGDLFDARIPLLFSFMSRGDDRHEFSLLAGFFKYRKTELGRQIRFFWLPVYTSDKKLTGTESLNTIAEYDMYEDEKKSREPHWENLRGDQYNGKGLNYYFRF